MPVKAGAACRRPGCAGIVVGGVCSRCGPLRRARDAAIDERRGTAAERGYDARWQRVRLMFLRAHPLCQDCAEQGRVTEATDVHHVVAKRLGGTDEESNLRALCHSCHSKITAAGG